MNRQQIEVIGRVVIKPEVKKSKADNNYSQVRIAVNSLEKDSKKKEEEIVTYYNILTFGRRAEKTINLDKGNLLRVRGNLKVKPFLSKSGEAKVDLTVLAKDFQVLDTDVFK